MERPGIRRSLQRLPFPVRFNAVSCRAALVDEAHNSRRLEIVRPRRVLLQTIAPMRAAQPGHTDGRCSKRIFRSELSAAKVAFSVFVEGLRHHPNPIARGLGIPSCQG